MALPASVLLNIFNFLPAKFLTVASEVSRQWYRVSRDEQLWRRLFLHEFKLDPRTKLAPNAHSWLSEYACCVTESPIHCAQIHEAHNDEVLRAIFSDDGTLLATVSKDQMVIIWSVNPGGYELKRSCQTDVSFLDWDYPRFCQFNEAKSRILITGRDPAQVAVFELAPKERAIDDGDGDNDEQEEDQDVLQMTLLSVASIRPSLATSLWIDNDRILLSTVLPGPMMDLQLLSIQSCSGDSNRSVTSLS